MSFLRIVSTKLMQLRTGEIINEDYDMYETHIGDYDTLDVIDHIDGMIKCKNKEYDNIFIYTDSPVIAEDIKYNYLNKVYNGVQINIFINDEGWKEYF